MRKMKISGFIFLSILVLAFLLRVLGTFPGYPPYHSDEGISYSSAISMIKNSNLDPLRYDYPALVPLINMVFYKLIFIPLYWIKFYIFHAGEIIDGLIKIPLGDQDYHRVFQLEILGQREINALVWSRIITAFFGVGNVYLIYKLAQGVANKYVGLAAAFLVATNFRQVLNSHLGLPDIYNSLFLLGSLYFITKILQNPRTVNYLLAGLFMGLYLSVKFQTFVLPSFLFAHLAVSYNNSDKKLKSLIYNFLSWKFLLTLTSTLLVFLIFNPYLIINLEKFLEVQNYQLSKYGLGSRKLNFYSLSYLYQIGVGKVISFLIVLGLLINILKFRIFILPIIFCISAFFYMFLYYSDGGFYTRNFITITPLLLLFPGIVLFEILRPDKGRLRQLLFILIFITISLGNIKNSFIVAREYLKPWNYKILSSWVSENIPSESVVAAHSSVPLPIENVKRTDFDFYNSFSLEEFRNDGAEWAIANLDWATNEYYWWMKGGTKDSLKTWNKPVEILEFMYPSLALREMEDFAVYQIVNPWQAPDSNFLVSKVPQYRILKKERMIEYSFDEGTEGWIKKGKMWYPEDNLTWENKALVILKEPMRSSILRWESPPIKVWGWKGFNLLYLIDTQGEREDLKGGYISVSFYENETDIGKPDKRLGVRVSARSNPVHLSEERNLIGLIPEKARHMIIGFQAYDTARTYNALDYIKVYKSDVELNSNDVRINPVYLNQDILFPNSHGNL